MVSDNVYYKEGWGRYKFQYHSAIWVSNEKPIELGHMIRGKINQGIRN